jgi:hypothetical protein
MIYEDECGEIGGGETEIVGENLDQLHFVYNKSHLT